MRLQRRFDPGKMEHEVFELLLILLAIILVYIGVTWAGARGIARLFGRALDTQQAQTEHILESGLAPGHWFARQQRQIRRLERRGASPRRVLQVKERSKKRLVKRLYRLLLHFERANVFSDEESREAVTRRIREVGKSWETRDWNHITGTDAETVEEDRQWTRG